MPTVREGDGLALSSRNAYLSADERAQAVALPQRARDRARRDSRRDAGRRRRSRSAKQSLVDAGFLRVDYVALVDAATLEPLDEPARRDAPDRRRAIGPTRLIDNIPSKWSSLEHRLNRVNHFFAIRG